MLSANQARWVWNLSSDSNKASTLPTLHRIIERGVVVLTIEVEINPQTEARLAAQAAARSMDVSAYAAALLERAAHSPASEAADFAGFSAGPRPAGKKSLAQLFADSPFKGLDLDFERAADTGRNIAL